MGELQPELSIKILKYVFEVTSLEAETNMRLGAKVRSLCIGTVELPFMSWEAPLHEKIAAELFRKCPVAEHHLADYCMQRIQMEAQLKDYDKLNNETLKDLYCYCYPFIFFISLFLNKVFFLSRHIFKPTKK